MAWFKRRKEGITTRSEEKREIPDGIWYHCKKCRHSYPIREHISNLYVCVECDYHQRIGAFVYLELLLDPDDRYLLFSEIQSVDALGFKDKKPYDKRLIDTKEKTGLDEAIQIASGTIGGHRVVMGAMDFSFIGGSMGSVVGERISKAIDTCIEEKRPLIIISKSGGARMMESAFSLMQMAKTAAKLTLLAKAKLPYISILTDPTTGGVSASFAMLGDLNIAEPESLIGFAGPRVIRETIKRDLPDGFQTSEFLLENGFLDKIVHRKNLRETLIELLGYFPSK